MVDEDNGHYDLDELPDNIANSLSKAAILNPKEKIS